MLSAISRRLSAARSLCRCIGLNESGSVMAFVVAVPVIAGAVAIGVETGQLYRVKRQMQISADAAALAASIDVAGGKSASLITSNAQYEAQRNGFTNGTNGVTVTVNTPPTSGSYTGATGAAEVIVTKTQKFSLGGVVLNWLGQANNNFTMRARAVAVQTSATNTTTSNSSDACIIALTPNNEQGVSISQMNNFGTDCSIFSNGTATGTTSSTSSIDMNNFNNVTIHSSTNDARIWTRGSFTSSKAITADQILQNQTTSIFDPYSNLGTPSPNAPSSNDIHTNYAAPNDSQLTLYPGIYYGGLRVTGKNKVYFKPGTYYIVNGDLIISSDNNVSCPDCSVSNGVAVGTTFVLTQSTGNNSDIGGVSITSENNVTLNAPSSGDYPGVLFYQDRRATAGTMASTSKIFTVASLNNATLNGAIYFPQNRIDISSLNNIGGTPNMDCAIWVGRYIKFSNFNNNYKGGCRNYNTTPVGITTTTTTTTTSNKVVWDGR